MSIAKAHYNYARLLMIDEAKKLNKMQRDAASLAKAKKESYDSVLMEDKKLRPGKPTSWYQATAKSVVNSIEKISRNAIKSSLRKLKKKNKEVGLNTVDFDGMMSAALLGLAVGKNRQAMGRRQFLGLAMGVSVLGYALLSPDEAYADNRSLIKQISDAIKKFADSFEYKAWGDDDGDGYNDETGLPVCCSGGIKGGTRG